MEWQRNVFCQKNNFAQQSDDPSLPRKGRQRSWLLRSKVMTPHCQERADSEAGFCAAKVMTPHCQERADSEAGFCAAKVMSQTLEGFALKGLALSTF
ncbi:hypothetical protein [Anaerotignum neopropionicum]|uniref:hypothetical protein n=1 Tax=Anaerotignum neopropionicum TaxID=36847 RepID=UPI0012FD1146|nr:hypothetical protein [Anaerotignum neopropionicum]